LECGGKAAAFTSRLQSGRIAAALQQIRDEFVTAEGA
jgi:hypothetical protein